MVFVSFRIPFQSLFGSKQDMNDLNGHHVASKLNNKIYKHGHHQGHQCSFISRPSRHGWRVRSKIFFFFTNSSN